MSDARVTADAFTPPTTADALTHLSMPMAEAMRTRRSIVTPTIPDTYPANIAQDAEHLEIMRRLDFRTSMTVPLEARGDVLGALAFFSSVC